MTRSEILSRYRRLRQISKEQHEAVLNIIAPDVVLDWARRIGLTQGKTVVSDSEAEIPLAEDLAIYRPRLGHSHPLDRYARAAGFAPGAEEAIVLAAMRQARFSLWRVERDHETTGLILRDLLREEEIWLIDEAMAKNARPGQEMAARLVEPDRFAMTARVIVPIIPDLMTRPELMEEVFIRAPALRSPQGGRPLPRTRVLPSVSIAPPWPQEQWTSSASSGNRPALRVQTHSSCLSKAPKSR